jgi:beta-glucosidase
MHAGAASRKGLGREPASWSGENTSRSTLDLLGRQWELFDAVAATGKRVIVLLVNGRPLAIP